MRTVSNFLKFKVFSFALIGLACMSCKDEEAVSTEYYVPAEFEPQESIWISAPTVDYKTGWSSVNAQANMIKEIITSAHVDYAVNSEADVQSITNALNAVGVTADQISASIRFRTVDHADMWIRDTGGTFMRNKSGDRRIVDFDFDAYRMKDYLIPETYELYEFDNDVSLRMAEALDIPVVTSSLITEGGNLHFNGKGTLIAIEKSLVRSNPGMTRAQIIDELKRVLNVKKVILINSAMSTDSHPVLESPVTFEGQDYFNLGVWHIDEMVTWLNPTTVLLPQVSASDLESGNPFVVRANEALEEAFETLSRETDQDGHPLTIVRSIEPPPIPVELVPGDLMYDFLGTLIGIRNFPTDGSPIQFVLAASYMNYVIANDVVLIPKLYTTGADTRLQETDEAFRLLMVEHFPGKRVVQIENHALTVGGGGMHCITQQMPAE